MCAEREDEQDSEDIWERRIAQSEPMRWYARFLLYRDMGSARTLLGTVHLEEQKPKKAQKSPKKPSESVPGAWKDAFRDWEWRKRAEAWDEEQERLAQAACKYTRISERVKVLDRWVDTQDGIMRTSVKDAGYARADSIEQLRGLLDDIAKETGGRVRQTKASVDHRGAIDIQGARDRLLDKLNRLPDDNEDDGEDDGGLS